MVPLHHSPEKRLGRRLPLIRLNGFFTLFLNILRENGKRARGFHGLSASAPNSGQILFLM